MGEPRFHRGRHAERLVQPREIVVHEVQRDGGLVVARHTLSRRGCSRSVRNGLARGSFVDLEVRALRVEQKHNT